MPIFEALEPRLLLSGTVAGQVWDDLNADGVNDASEPGLDGWTVELVEVDSGLVVDTVVTAGIDLDLSGDIDPESEAGRYSFTVLNPGPVPDGPVAQVIDNSSPSGFYIGNVRWFNTPGVDNAYNNDCRRYNGTTYKAWWVFDDLPIGLYKVWTSWGTSTLPGGSSIPYTLYEGGTITQTGSSGGTPKGIYSGGTLISSQTVDQSVPAVDENMDGIWWQSLGRHVVDGRLVVEIAGPQDVPDGETHYAFADAVRIERTPSNYIIREVSQPGWTPSLPANQHRGVLLEDGQSIEGQDFGNYQPASLSGQKFEDLDSDGVKDAGEPGLDGWTIELVDPSTSRVIDTAVTLEGGFYTFANLAPGDYELHELLQDGWVQTYPEANLHSLTLACGEEITDKDFGNARASTISGQKFEDLDGDRVKDAGELGLDGWIVELVDADTGELFDSQSTSGGGLYSFVDLLPGSYEVRELLRPGWVRTFPSAPVHSITLGYDEHHTGIDFGNYRIPGSMIMGRVWEDLDANGVRDAGESGISGATVFLDVDYDGQLDPGEPSMLTLSDYPGTVGIDEAGAYHFTGLDAGTHKVVQVLEPGWVWSCVSEEISRVSVDSAGAEGISVNGNGSGLASISADGRYVAFESNIDSLVSGDTNSDRDILVHDRRTGLTERVSVDSAGVQANGDSDNPSISADGRYVGFYSDASNLVAEDTNGVKDIFVHDRQTGLTRRISVNSTGTQADADSLEPNISIDGRYVAFESDASNLVSGDTNGRTDIFVHDLHTGLTERVSVNSAGIQANSDSDDPSISADGKYVAFGSYASNLVSGDTGYQDIFVHDRQTGLTERVSVDSAGAEANGGSASPSINADGRYVAFQSAASNLVDDDTNAIADIFVYDRQTGSSELVSVDSAGTQANDLGQASSISADGRHIAFRSRASNLVPGDGGDQDIFVHDRQTGQIDLVSLGAQSNYGSWEPSISADGRSVAFHSMDWGFVDGDTNRVSDVFVSPVNAALATTSEWVFLGSSEIIGDVDIASYRAPWISGQKFEDLDYDGLKDAGELGLDGWTIELVDPSTGEVIAACTTSGGGYYSFTGLRPGDYELREVAQDGWVQTFPGLDAYSLTLLSGDVASDKDFGNSVAGAIWGRMFEDLDGDGVFDAGELGVRRFAIELVDSLTGQVIDTQTTSIGGFYSFTDLLPGDYEVREAAQDEWGQTLPTDPDYYSIALTYGQDVVGKDFGNRRLPGEIKGQVFSDFNSNAVRDPGEPGLNGWTIELVDSATGAAVDTTVTAGIDLDGSGDIDPETERGLYSFAGLDSGGYSVVQVAPPGWARAHVGENISRVSVSSAGIQGNDFSGNPTISADGRYVAFESVASNLVVGDTNSAYDVFVYDRQAGLIERVSVSSDGLQSDVGSSSPSISADGRYVAFVSYASTLVDDDTSGSQDIFVHDRKTGLTERVSVDPAGTQANLSCYSPEISADGRYVAFASRASSLVGDDTNQESDIFVHDRHTGLIQRVSVDSLGMQANDGSFHPDISADGRYVVFDSEAANLVADDTNQESDIFVHDQYTGLTRRVSIDSGGAQANGGSHRPSISADGRYAAFMSWGDLIAGDTNGRGDVFVHDRQTGLTELVSVDSAGTQGDYLSGDPASGAHASISADGRYVAFGSYASNLVTGDTNGRQDIFVHDRQIGLTECVSVNSVGAEGYEHSTWPSISADGRHVAFASNAWNLVAGDSNAARDIFVSSVTSAFGTNVEWVFLRSGQTIDSVDFGNHDIVAPVITVDTLTTVEVSPPLNGTVDDPDAVVEVSVDGNTYAARNNGDGTWTLGGGAITPSLGEGAYNVSASAIDLFGHIGTDITTAELTVYLPSQIVGRHVFYNSSSWDGGDPAANAADDDAIDTSKQALLPGGVATPTNYSGYWRGVNGIMVDIDGLAGTPTVGDVGVRVNQATAPDTWSAGPAPESVTVRAGQGVGGSDRVTIVWADGAILNQWVEVTVLATANTGLGIDDVFYLANLVGDCDGDGAVGSSDYGTFANQFGRRGGIGAMAADLNGDGRVDLADLATMRGAIGNSVSIPSLPSAAPGAIVESPLDTLAVPAAVTSVNPETTTDQSTVIPSTALRTSSNQLTANDAAAGIDLLGGSLSAAGYISGSQAISFGSSATRLQRAATAAYDLRPLRDDPASDGQATDLGFGIWDLGLNALWPESWD